MAGQHFPSHAEIDAALAAGTITKASAAAYRAGLTRKGVPKVAIDVVRTGRRLAFVNDRGVVSEATPEDIAHYLKHLNERGEIESRATVKLLCVAYREAWGGVAKGEGLGGGGVVVKQFWDFETVNDANKSLHGKHHFATSTCFGPDTILRPVVGDLIEARVEASYARLLKFRAWTLISNELEEFARTGKSPCKFVSMHETDMAERGIIRTLRIGRQDRRLKGFVVGKVLDKRGTKLEEMDRVLRSRYGIQSYVSFAEAYKVDEIDVLGFRFDLNLKLHSELGYAFPASKDRQGDFYWHGTYIDGGRWHGRIDADTGRFTDPRQSFSFEYLVAEHVAEGSDI